MGKMRTAPRRYNCFGLQYNGFNGVSLECCESRCEEEGRSFRPMSDSDMKEVKITLWLDESLPKIA